MPGALSTEHFIIHPNYILETVILQILSEEVFISTSNSSLISMNQLTPPLRIILSGLLQEEPFIWLHMKATEWHSPVVLFVILYKKMRPVGEIQICDHSNESYYSTFL